VPSTYNSTFEMRMLSVAVTDTKMVPLTMSPSEGDVMEVEGGTVSIVTLTIDEAGDVFPALSVAFAVML
jgi:hypothetical protein